MSRGRGDGPLFAEGGGFKTIGSGGGPGAGAAGRRDDRFVQIVCEACGTIIGMAMHGTNGPAYCGDCWEKLGGGGGDRSCVARDASDVEEARQRDEQDGEERESGCGACDEGEDGRGSEPEGTEAVPHGGGDRGEQARRLRALMRSLAAADGGPPARRDVLEAMVLDGGGGAWKTAEAAEWCLDNVLGGMVYEPTAGRLSMIDGE